MLGTPLIVDPPSFHTFQLAHRVDEGKHRFEVAYGSSFNELYYDFTPEEFLRSADRSELEKQFRRAGADWLISLLRDLASGSIGVTGEELLRMANSRGNSG